MTDKRLELARTIIKEGFGAKGPSGDQLRQLGVAEVFVNHVGGLTYEEIRERTRDAVAIAETIVGEHEEEESE